MNEVFQCVCEYGSYQVYVDYLQVGVCVCVCVSVCLSVCLSVC